MQRFLIGMGFSPGEAWIVILIVAVPTILGLLLTVLRFRHDRKVTRAAQQAEITKSHNQLIEFQKEHPELFRLGKEWTPDRMELVYSHHKDGNPEWALYYCYVEQCVNYCNMVLDARRNKVIRKQSYLSHHENTAKQIITENFPIIKNYMVERKYLSPFIADFVCELRNQNGWDWDREHELICWPGGKPAPGPETPGSVSTGP